MPKESSSPSTVTLMDTHITAVLMGVVLCDILSFISFDLRLASSMFQKRHFHPVPISYLVSRYTMLIFITVFSILTIPSASGTPRDETALHWLRPIMLPLLFTATSAILGFRAVILHFSQPFLVRILVNTLLAIEFVSSLAVMILSVSESPTPTSTSGSHSISAAWICAPLLIALLIDLIFTLIVVVPILAGSKQRGEILGMMLSDAIFFGVFSMVVKVIAIGLTIRLTKSGTNAWLPVRVEAVGSTIFAGRVFRGQEVFLREWKERMAKPGLDGVELERLRGTGGGSSDVEKGVLEGTVGVGGGLAGKDAMRDPGTSSSRSQGFTRGCRTGTTLTSNAGVEQPNRQDTADSRITVRPHS